MSDTVWVSAAYYDTTLIKPFNADVILEDLGRAAELSRRHGRGEALSPDEFPKAFYGKFRHKTYARQPDLFMAGGFWCVSATCADVLRRFDLRPGGLVPVRLFQHDRTTPVEGEYFGLNFGAIERAFVPEHSKANYSKISNTWTFLPKPADDDFAVAPAALEGADLWTDPTLLMGFFVSDRLAEALKAAKVSRNFRLKRCRVEAVEQATRGLPA